MFFSTTIFQKNVDFSGFRSGIVGVEGEYADHLTTAHQFDTISIGQIAWRQNFKVTHSKKLSKIDLKWVLKDRYFRDFSRLHKTLYRGPNYF